MAIMFLSMLAALAGPADAPAVMPSFCGQLAVPLKMKPPHPPERTFWRRDMLGSFGATLFGGVSVVSLQVTAPEPRTIEMMERAERMCEPREKGAHCVVAAPFGLRFIAKGQEILLAPGPGETGEVTVRGTIVECRDRRTETGPGATAVS